jgi:hypothetical protein
MGGSFLINPKDGGAHQRFFFDAVIDQLQSS